MFSCHTGCFQADAPRRTHGSHHTTVTVQHGTAAKAPSHLTDKKYENGFPSYAGINSTIQAILLTGSYECIILEANVYIANDSELLPYQAMGKLWSDKSVNFCVLPNAQISIHVDWTCMDPWVFFGLLERLRVAETPDMYDNSTGDAVSLEGADHECPDPETVSWQLYDEMVPIYKKAEKFCEIHFTKFGRTKVKCDWDLSVDSFIQSVLHLAYFRMTSQLALCAEYVPCRLYCNGRLETLRSLTNEMAEFVRGINSELEKNSAKNVKVLNSLRLACQRHDFLLKHASSGRGVDLHLISLGIANSFRSYLFKAQPVFGYVSSIRGTHMVEGIDIHTLGKKSEALEKVTQMPFDMVTCRLPKATSKNAWKIMMSLMDQREAIHVAYSSPSDLQCLDFTISGIGNRVEKFAGLVEQTLHDIEKLFSLHET